MSGRRVYSRLNLGINNFDKSRCSFITFGTTHPDTSMYYKKYFRL